VKKVPPPTQGKSVAQQVRLGKRGEEGAVFWETKTYGIFRRGSAGKKETPFALHRKDESSAEEGEGHGIGQQKKADKNLIKRREKREKE